MCSNEGARHPERAWDVDPGSKSVVEVDSAGSHNPPAVVEVWRVFVLLGEDPPGIKSEQGLLESWMNGNVHVQFGGGLLEKCLLR